ncbi:PREDICTED: uncharacterized protein LOC104605226 [Nelumbo nucifera]|uniref:Transmembrane protein n=2 Tax=Nelumbo nucifera TaxID=4432 RepID=A0A822Z8I4_NELNU|nr:PREDICTED: uncharacterized protein LOC104605226 [Nelumbo nucifera]DAD41157.1 TPA_asm: hypothetical protein HUJ06_015480 [Nelumbo nucifera]
MAYGKRSQTSSILEVFTLNPLPYPVLLILAVLFIFLGTSWYFSYESAVEAAEEKMSWALMAVPIVLLVALHWLSSIDNPHLLFATSPADRRRRSHHQPSEGTSPWIVAAVIVLLLIMISYQSTFLDNWSV